MPPTLGFPCGPVKPFRQAIRQSLLVVHGDLRHGREVVRASVDLPDFPAHRVLPPGGQVPRGWRSYATKTPDPGECVRLLCGEGVPVDGEGRAARAHRVGWDLLAERAAEAGRLG